MRSLATASLLALALAGAARAQAPAPAGPVPASPAPASPIPAGPAPIIATPLPPLDAETTAPGADQAPQVLPRAPRYADTWLPRQKATIQALDKVNARFATLTIPIGQTATYQSLTITVRSCLERPADQPADAAVFVTVTDKADPARPTALWLLRSAPAVSMLQHPIFDLRVMGCTS